MAALFVAMTLGGLALMMLETEPVRPTAQPLAVLSPPPTGTGEIVYETHMPLQPVQWRYVVVHASPDAADDLARGCHFLVTPGRGGEGKVLSTDHWLQQRQGRHMGGFWQDSSVGVCLIGDFSHQGPPPGQFDALVDLVHTLQEVCKIPADRVYLHSDVVARSPSPGAAFPAAKFTARLLRPQR